MFARDESLSPPLRRRGASGPLILMMGVGTHTALSFETEFHPSPLYAPPPLRLRLRLVCESKYFLHFRRTVPHTPSFIVFFFPDLTSQTPPFSRQMDSLFFLVVDVSSLSSLPKPVSWLPLNVWGS